MELDELSIQQKLPKIIAVQSSSKYIVNRIIMIFVLKNLGPVWKL